MITCPLCEHQQAAGSECEVCGRRLEEGRGTDAPVPALEGLELTSLDAGGLAGAAPLEPVPDLEATHFAPSAAPVAELVADLEPTRAAPVEAVSDPTPDVERVLAGLPEDGPTVLPVTLVCRYCRTEAHPSDRLCARCGMRLPVTPARPAAAAAAPRLCSCGTPVTRSTCPACGARNATP